MTRHKLSIVGVFILAGATWPNLTSAQPSKDAVHATLGLVRSSLIEVEIPVDPGDFFSVAVDLAGKTHTLHLARRSVRAEGYQLLVQDSSGKLEPHAPGEVPTLVGIVEDDKAARIVGGLLDGGLFARVEFGVDQRYWIEPLAGRVPGASPRDHVVYEPGDTAYWGECGGGGSILGGAVPFGGAPCGGDHCFVQLACDADVEFFQDSGSISRTQSRVEIIVHLANNAFEREASLTHHITATIVRTAQPDPYTVTESVALLAQVAAEWGPGTHGGIARDTVHMFTGRDVDGTVIGRAYEAVICDAEFGMGFSQSNFNTNMASVSDLTVHELGHNWSADHCTCAAPPYTMNPGITSANRFHPTESLPQIIAHRDSRTCLSAQRVNDFCSAALEICPGTISGSTTNTSNSAAIGCGTNALLDSWYLYRPAVSGVATIHTNGSSMDTVMAVWDGCPGPAAATRLDCDDDSGIGNASLITVNVVGGRAYLIQIARNNNLTGTFSLTIEGPPCEVPFHDVCEEAWNIGPGEFFGTTSAATDDGDSSCGASLLSADVWYRYTPQSNGIVVADTCDSQFDTVLSVFTDCPLQGGVELACNDDSSNGCGSSAGDLQSRVEFTASGGTTYYFRVSGHFGVRGSYRFRLSGPQARNDACNTPLTVPLGRSYHSMVGMTPSSLTPGCGGDGSIDAFFRFIAPANGLLVVSTCGTNDLYGDDSGMDTVLALYPSCGAAPLLCNDDAAAGTCPGNDLGDRRDSLVSIETSAGFSYIIRVAVFSGGAPAPFVLNVALVPENDLCADALTVGEGTHYGDLQFATGSGGTSCATVSGADVFYRFTAPFSGRVVVTTCGTHDFGGVDGGMDTLLSLHSSNCTGFLTEFDCNSNWNVGASFPNACSGGLDAGLARDAAVSMLMNAGQTVRIRVAATSTTTPGPFFLNIFLVPTNDLCADAIPVMEGTRFGTFGAATTQSTAPCLPVNLTSIDDVWFSYTAQAAGTLFVNTCGTHDLNGVDLGVDTNLTVYSGNCTGFIGIFDCNDTYSAGDSLDPLACEGEDDGLARDAAARVTMNAGQTVNIRLGRTVALAPPFPDGGIFQLNVSFVDAVAFRRGDCNGDGLANIADAVTLLSVLFPMGTPPTLPCQDACDANDDEMLNIADVVAALAALFGSPPLPLPPPIGCGNDPTAGSGTLCASYSHCP